MQTNPRSEIMLCVFCPMESTYRDYNPVITAKKIKRSHSLPIFASLFFILNFSGAALHDYLS